MSPIPLRRRFLVRSAALLPSLTGNRQVRNQGTAATPTPALPYFRPTQRSITTAR